MSQPPKWTCRRCGECCTVPRTVTLTAPEAADLAAHAPGIVAVTCPDPVDPRFVSLTAGPCPYYQPSRTKGACAAYRARPYNCRRYLCGRDDPRRESFEDAAVPERVVANRALRKLYRRTQREAQGWAVAHGWRPSEEGAA